MHILHEQSNDKSSLLLHVKEIGFLFAAIRYGTCNHYFLLQFSLV